MYHYDIYADNANAVSRALVAVAIYIALHRHAGGHIRQASAVQSEALNSLLLAALEVES